MGRSVLQAVATLSLANVAKHFWWLAQMRHMLDIEHTLSCTGHELYRKAPQHTSILHMLGTGIPWFVVPLCVARSGNAACCFQWHTMKRSSICCGVLAPHRPALPAQKKMRQIYTVHPTTHQYIRPAVCVQFESVAPEV